MNTNNIRVVLLTVVMLLTASAVGAVNYPSYKPSRAERMYYQQVNPTYNYRTPNMVSRTPMLNEDGTAIAPNSDAPSAGPRRNEVNPNPFGGNTTGNGDPLEPGGTPIGSAWVLLLFALGYAGLTAYHRRKAEA